MDLIINTFGTRIRSSGERISLVFPKNGGKKEYPARRIEKIIILRPSSISTGAVQLAIEHDIPAHICRKKVVMHPFKL